MRVGFSSVPLDRYSGEGLGRSGPRPHFSPRPHSGVLFPGPWRGQNGLKDSFRTMGGGRVRRFVKTVSFDN